MRHRWQPAAGGHAAGLQPLRLLDCQWFAGESGRQGMSVCLDVREPMRARNLIEPFPTVGLDTDALEAAQLMGANGLSGLIVCSEDGSPHSVLPGSEVLRFVIPRYVQDDP